MVIVGDGPERGSLEREAAQAGLGLLAAAIQAFQGMLLFFLLGVDVLSNYRVRLVKESVA